MAFEIFEMQRYDRFEFIKNFPKNLFYESTAINDVTTYLDNLKRKFKKLYNYTTLDIILENENPSDFNTEISDLLFEQFYLQKQNISDYYKSLSYNYNISGFQFRYLFRQSTSEHI